MIGFAVNFLKSNTIHAQQKEENADIARAKSFRSQVAHAWSLSMALISGFCSVERMKISDSPWRGH